MKFRLSEFRLIATKVLLALIALILVTVLAGYLYLRQSLAKTEGAIALPGLSGSVELLRDANGIPHIHAHSIEDAYFGLGFAHAQDRLWQMEMNRRTAAGRLAEILGASALDTDRFLRTLGIRRAAQRNFGHLSSDTRSALEAYARGVNAFLETDPVLPPEFLVVRARPEPWSPVDSLGWVKMMAWDLGGNWRNELLRMRLASRMPMSHVQEFLAPYPGEEAIRLPDVARLYSVRTNARTTDQADVPADVADVFTGSGNRALPADHLDRLLAAAPPAVGSASNNWAASGERTRSGKPLLANDPHLSLSMPSIWYFAHLSAPGLEVTGATLPGVPGVVLGRNARIAWGFTNTGPDVQDLYVEKLGPNGGYLTPRGYQAFEVIEDIIKVRGGPDVPLKVRISRHGPVISDALPAAPASAPAGHVLAFQWTALMDDDQSSRAVLEIGRAGNWTEFLLAARHFHAPQQNMLYADVEGNIGFIAAGRVPIRKPKNDLHGLLPAPGWLERYDWAGFIPFEQLPRRFNPAGGTLATANEKIVPPGYRYSLTSEWDPPYRARRVAELLAATPKHDPASFERMQADTLSLALRDLMPRLLQTPALSEAAKAALSALGKWDLRMSAERSEPLIMAAWWREIARGIYRDELGELFTANWDLRPVFLDNVLSDRNGQSRWCDDARTAAVETCAEILAAALDRALADLRRRYGDDMREWRWDKAHFAKLEHRPFDRIAWLARFFSLEVPASGGAFTLNRARYRISNEAAPFAGYHGSSLRAIYDMGNPENSRFIHSGGQSGNLLATDYAGFTAAWAGGRYVPMRMDRAAIEAAGVRRLVLNPR